MSAAAVTADIYVPDDDRAGRRMLTRIRRDPTLTVQHLGPPSTLRYRVSGPGVDVLVAGSLGHITREDLKPVRSAPTTGHCEATPLKHAGKRDTLKRMFA